MRDARGFEERDGLAINRRPHRVAHRFQRELVPGLGGEIHGIRAAPPGEAFRALLFFGRVGGHRLELVIRAAIALIGEDHALRRDAHHADVAVVRAGEIPVVKLRRHRRCTGKAELHFDHAVLRRHVRTDHRLMSLHRRLAIRRRRIKAHLRALQRPFLQRENGHDLSPSLAQLGALEVIGKKQLLLLRDRRRRDRGKVRGKSGHGEEEERGEEVVAIHWKDLRKG